MKKESELWIEAGRILSKDASASIKCPKCQKGFLKTLDVDPGSDYDVMERYMTCEDCGATNILRMHK